jgi:hypothetical protein
MLLERMVGKAGDRAKIRLLHKSYVCGRRIRHRDEPGHRKKTAAMPLKTVRPATSVDEAAVIALWKDCGLVTSYNDPAKDFHFAGAKDNSILGSVMVGHDGHRGWIYYVNIGFEVSPRVIMQKWLADSARDEMDLIAHSEPSF